MQPLAAAELKHRGIASDHFASQLLDMAAAERAHLVLTATRRHRDEMISQAPAIRPYTFTWRELARLVEGLGPDQLPGRYPVERLANLVEVARGRRGYLQPLSPELYDVADPMGRGKQDYRIAAAQIEEAVETILNVL